MSLSAKDKDTVKTFWAKVSGRQNDIGSDAVARMLAVYPQTKTYFSHWKDLSAGSAPVKKHGRILIAAVTDAVKKIDDLTGGLSKLSDLHASTLRVDPANFKLLAQSLLVVLSTMFSRDFTPEVHMAMDKFLSAVARALSERYR